MSVLENFRRKVLRYRMRDSVPPEGEKKFLKLHQAEQVAILFNGDNPGDREAVYHFEKELRQAGRQIFVLGFIVEREKDVIYKFPFFAKEDLNWYYRPSGRVVEDFLSRTYDILIDFTLEDILPLEYMLLHARARMKVGFYRKGLEDHYDVMFNASERNADTLIENVKMYL